MLAKLLSDITAWFQQSLLQGAALFFAKDCINMVCFGKNYKYPSPPAEVEVEIRGFLHRTRQHGGEGPFWTYQKVYICRPFSPQSLYIFQYKKENSPVQQGSSKKPLN
jgi:hypothetical protein